MNRYQPSSAFSTNRSGAAHPLLLATAAVSGLLVVSCLVCAGLTYLGVNRQVTSQLQAQFGDDPVVTQHIGEIQSAWVNVDDSQAIQQQEGRETYIVYDVQGSEADGQLIVQQGTGENLVGDRGFLRVENGDFELTPPPPAPEEQSKDDAQDEKTESDTP